MKKTQLKDALYNIWKQKVSYLSIIVIAFLGVTTFLGISYSDGALRRNGSIMYNDVNYRDLEIISSALFTDEDLEAILETDGVADAEAVWQTGAKVFSGGTRQDVNVITLTERINLPELIEGRLPEAAGECAVERRLAEEMGWRVGDSILALNAKGETADYLLDGCFDIVGIANHPDHTSVSIPDTLYVMVTKVAFDLRALDDCFMKAEIVVDKPADIDRFSASYEAATEAVSTRLEEVASRRSVIRDVEIKGQAQSQMDEAQQELDDAFAELEQARGQLDEGWLALQDGETQYAEQEAMLTDAQAQLETAWEQLQEGARQVETAQAKLASAKAKLDKGKKTLRNAREQLDSARSELIEGWNALEDIKAQIRKAIRKKLGSAARGVHWAPRQEVNIDDPGETAMEFWITTTYKFDLNKSLKQNIRDFINSGGISDEALVALYLELIGGST